MRVIKQSAQFKRDLKRESRGPHGRTLKNSFVSIVAALANDEPLAPQYLDHGLTGNWRDCRDCHIKPDLVLIYRKPDDELLQLVRLGSHSELGL